MLCYKGMDFTTLKPPIAWLRFYIKISLESLEIMPQKFLFSDLAWDFIIPACSSEAKA